MTLEARVMDLESRLAFQDDTIQALNDVLVAQQNAVDRLQMQMAALLKRGLSDAYRQLADLKTKELLDRRYERLQSYGRFSDTKAEN